MVVLPAGIEEIASTETEEVAGTPVEVGIDELSVIELLTELDGIVEAEFTIPVVIAAELAGTLV